MFVSFFPRPKLFFISAVVCVLLGIALWYGVVDDLGSKFGIAAPPADAPVGVALLWTGPSLWLYLYMSICLIVFASVWTVVSQHPWARWSVFGSAFILFITYFQVQVHVVLVAWSGAFFNLLQKALEKAGSVPAEQLYGLLAVFAGIAMISIMVSVVTSFFVSHYIFRWRTAMNDYYLGHWSKLRVIEGASQRVQEDTMRFAQTLEDLGVNLIQSVMTLVAFLPILISLSSNITSLPVVGVIPYPLVVAAVVWSLFGTALLALIGIRLPGIEFHNQRVEAAYRKELVLGEDNPARADPPTVKELFAAIRRNYFRLYLNFLYFNIARAAYIQTDAVVSYLLLIPSIFAGHITLGIIQQIARAFGQVSSSFQFLVSSWSTIVVLISIYQRLKAFEARIHDEPLPKIETQEGELQTS